MDLPPPVPSSPLFPPAPLQPRPASHSHRPGPGPPPRRARRRPPGRRAGPQPRARRRARRPPPPPPARPTAWRPPSCAWARILGGGARSGARAGPGKRGGAGFSAAGRGRPGRSPALTHARIDAPEPWGRRCSGRGVWGGRPGSAALCTRARAPLSLFGPPSPPGDPPMPPPIARRPAPGAALAAAPARAARGPRIAARAAARRFFVGGNWKSNCTKASVEKLVAELNGAVTSLPDTGAAEIVVAPEHIHLSMVLDAVDGRYAVAAQNCWKTSGGAYTGEVRGGAMCLGGLGGVQAALARALRAAWAGQRSLDRLGVGEERTGPRARGGRHPRAAARARPPSIAPAPPLARRRPLPAHDDSRLRARRAPGSAGRRRTRPRARPPLRGAPRPPRLVAAPDPTPPPHPHPFRLPPKPWSTWASPGSFSATRSGGRCSASRTSLSARRWSTPSRRAWTLLPVWARRWPSGRVAR